MSSVQSTPRMTFRSLITHLIIMISCLAWHQGLGQSLKCNILQDGIDLQTKTYRIEVAPALLFNYTPPEVKNELQADNLMKCQAQIVKIEDKVSLQLNLKINSLKAQTVYGEVAKTNMMKIILIDGKEIKLECYAGSRGVLSQNKKSYTYPLGYQLSNRDIKTLSKKEIDKIGIQWSSGYEEYIIYEIDFLMNQLACLERASNQKPN